VFGRPTNLTDQEAVRLVLRSVSAAAVVILNDKILGPAPAIYDVTSALELRNVLTLSLVEGGESEETGREPPFDVRLEIESQGER
jgi:hypothetical protein